MKILMLQPIFPPTFWNSEASARLFYRRSAAVPPLGLLTVASYLPEDFEVRVVDRNIAEETDEDWLWADVVFLSLMSVQIADYRVCVKVARLYGKPIAVGGPFVHARREIVAEDADWMCVGEAEDIMAEFVADLRADRRGKVYEGGHTVNMAECRTPRFELIPRLNDYFIVPVQFSRGCPFQCEFCDIIEISGRVPRSKTPTQVIRELDKLVKLGFRGLVMIVDDNFIGNKHNAKGLLKGIAAWNRLHDTPLTFLLEASVDLADDEELLCLMHEANVLTVFLGIETPDPSLLKTTRKFQNMSGNTAARVDRIRAHGIHVIGGFVIGFDGEADDVFETQREFIQDLAIGTALVGLLTAIPHTQLWRRLTSEGRLLDLEVAGGQTIDGINFIPIGSMTRREYFERYIKFLREVYSPEAYFERTTRALLKTRATCSLRLDLRTLRWVIPSILWKIWYLGIRDRQARRHYLASLLTMIRYNPSAIEAFGFDSYFYHHFHNHAEYLTGLLRKHLDDPRNADVLDGVMEVV